MSHTLLTFLTPKKEMYFNCETVKELGQRGQISLLDLLCAFRENTTNKMFAFQIIHLTLFLLSQQVLFLCKHHANFLHFKMLPSFCVNLLYLKVISTKFALSRYLNFKECWFPWIRYLYKAVGMYFGLHLTHLTMLPPWTNSIYQT